MLCVCVCVWEPTSACCSILDQRCTGDILPIPCIPAFIHRGRTVTGWSSSNPGSSPQASTCRRLDETRKCFSLLFHPFICGDQ